MAPLRTRAVIAQIEGYGQIDIVSYGSAGYTDLRVYADAADTDQAAALFEALANVLVSGDDKKNIPDCIEKIRKGDNGNLFLGANYGAYFNYGEVFLNAGQVAFE